MLNICLGYKSRKNWSILTKFGYVFAVSNINLCSENFGRILVIFYRVITKYWVPVFIYFPLSINLCDNTHVITRMGSITGFEQWPTASKFCLEILEKVFEESSKMFFHKSIQTFFKNFSKNDFSEFCTRIFFISRYLLNEWSHIYPYFCYCLKGLLFI